jgi:hypothetical protein
MLDTHGHLHEVVNAMCAGCKLGFKKSKEHFNYIIKDWETITINTLLFNIISK